MTKFERALTSLTIILGILTVALMIGSLSDLNQPTTQQTRTIASLVGGQ